MVVYIELVQIKRHDITITIKIIAHTNNSIMLNTHAHTLSEKQFKRAAHKPNRKLKFQT